MNDIILPENWKTALENCFSYKELSSIPIHDNQEPLVNLEVTAKKELLLGEPSEKSKQFVSSGMWVRQGVADRLINAQNLIEAINPNYKLKICYGYRHPEIQKKYFVDFKERTKTAYPDFNEQQILEYAHHYIAIPEVAGHPAGAAVDVLIFDTSSNQPINVGNQIGDLSDLKLVPTFSSLVSEEHLQNRLILRKAMMQSGFAAYDFEWWHFSYGDREWACYYKKDFAIYGEIDFRC